MSDTTLAVGQLVRGPEHAYQLERELGRGGFGTTFLATRENDGHQVALKSLHVARLAEWKSMELFEREIAVLRRLSHPRVPDYVDDFSLGDDPEVPEGLILVQEFVDGFPLSAVVRGERSMDETQMLSWFVQVLEVMEYLHHLSPPVIHRDITPKNILIRDDGTAYLVDFGSVQAALRSASTVASTSAGTFGYAPMEQFVSAAFPASDMYGLAMTCLAAASGREPSDMPFSGIRVDVRQLVDFDARLTLLLQRMTEPDPERRLGEARIALEELRPLAARIAPETQRLAEIYRRERAPEARVEVASDDLLPSERSREAARRLELMDGASLSLPPLEAELTDLYTSAMSANGSTLAVDNFLIDVDDMTVITRLPGSQRVVAMTPSADVVVTYHEDSWDHDQLSVFERRDGRYDRRHAIKVEGDGMTAISPDGNSLARLSEGDVLLYDLRQGSLTQRIKGRFESVRFSADGQIIGCYDDYADSARLFFANGRDTTIRKIHEIAFAPDGRMAAIMRGHEVLFGTVDELMAGRGQSASGGGDFTWKYPCFSPDGAWLAALDYSADQILVIDVEARQRALTLRSPGRPKERVGSVTFVGFSADSARLLVGCDAHYNRFSPEKDDCVAVWSLPEGRYLGAIMRVASGGPPAAIAAAGYYGMLPWREHDPDDQSAAKQTRKREKKYGNALSDNPWHRPEVARDAVRGERIDEALGQVARAQLADMEERWAYFQDLMASGVVDPEANLLAMLDSSRGLTHVLDLVRRRARDAQRQSPMFGAGQQETRALTGDQIMRAARELAASPSDELALLYQDLVAEAERAERERARELAEARSSEQNRSARARKPEAKVSLPVRAGSDVPARAADPDSRRLMLVGLAGTSILLAIIGIVLLL